MDIDNIQSQMRKGVLEYCILATLATQDAYAPDIIRKLHQASLAVVEGTLYPILTRQKNAGLLTYRWEESTMGPPRKYYTLTEKGKAVLLQMHQAWEELTQAVRTIKSTDIQSDT